MFKCVFVMSKSSFCKPQVLAQDAFHKINYKEISRKEYLNLSKNDFDYTVLKRKTHDFDCETPFCSAKKLNCDMKRVSHLFL